MRRLLLGLLLLGLARWVREPGASPAVRRELQADLERLRAAVGRSGLADAELWSYRLERDALRPARYGTSSDLQLWSLTDLAVQFALADTAVEDHP